MIEAGDSTVTVVMMSQSREAAQRGTGKLPRRPDSRSASYLPRASFAEIPQSLPGRLGELACLGVTLDLPIEMRFLPRLERRAKAGEFARWELRNGLFDVVECRHVESLPQALGDLKAMCSAF